MSPDSCVNLWLAVIQQQVNDATYGTISGNDTTYQAKIRRYRRKGVSPYKKKQAKDARHYLRESPSCKYICDLIDLDHDFLLRKLENQIAKVDKDIFGV